MYRAKRTNFNLIRNSVSFSELASEYGVLFENNKAICPFHEEKTPSLHDYGEYGYCFGCGKRVDVIDLEAYFNELSPIRAAKSLMKRFNLEIKGDRDENYELSKRKKLAKRLLRRFSVEANAELIKNANVQNYLNQRGLNEVDLSKYLIGYIPQKGLNLSKIIKFKSEIEIAKEIGLLESDNVNFKNRIILPVWSFGEITYITTRSFDGEEPKYLHLKNSDLISKPIAFSENLSQENCIVTEGVFESIAFLKAGYPACALLGVNLGEKCKNDLDRATANIYFCFDSDQAGIKASYNLAKEFKGSIMNLNKDMDADEVLLKFEMKKFKQIVKRSIKESQYYLDMVIAKENLNDAINIVAGIESQVEKGKATNQLFEKYENLGFTKVSIGELVEKARKGDSCSDAKSNIEKANSNTFIAHFEGLVDLVDYQGEVNYLIKDKDELIIKSSYEHDGIILYPPEKGDKPPDLVMPRAEEVVKYYKSDSDSKLYDDLLTHHKAISELPSDKYYILLALWVLHTYLIEKCKYSPYLWLYALAERGKTRTGKGCIYIAYRGHHDISLREAHLFRWSSHWRASLFLDVADIKKKAISENSLDILLQRFEQGGNVSRVMNPDRGPFKDMVHYEIYGPTIIATNEPVDELLESRAIQINMPESNKIYEVDLDPYMFRGLKERLVAFRARNMYKRFPERSKPARGRLGDILKPYSQILALVKPEEEVSFQELVDVLQNTKMEEKSQSFEGKIFKTIIDLEDRIKGGLLSVKSITKRYNSTLEEKFRIDVRKVGHVITKLALDRKHKEDGAYIVWDEEKIKNLKMRFGLLNYEPRSKRFLKE